MAMVCAMGSYAYDLGDYAYTATQRVKITDANQVTNGDFAEGFEGWINAAGEEVNSEVWTLDEGLGPNGENVLTSQSAATADAAICQKWDLQPGSYIVMYDIKGEATTATYLTPAGTNNIDFFLTSTDNPVYTRVDANDGTVSVATTDGYTAEWKTNAYFFEIGDGQSLVMHMEKLTAETQITNIQIYAAEEVYDDRVLRNKLDYVDKLVATGKFEQDTENEFVANIVETVRGMLETEGALDDKSSIEGMMESYEEELTAWLNVNGADMLSGETRWSAYGDTRKKDGIGGNWQGTGGRWFHKNNGGSNIITDDGDEIGHRLQGRMAAAAASQYYPITPKTAGTYMFSMDIVGHYMQGTATGNCPITGVAPQYTIDWNREFKGVTMFAGKDILGSDADANAELDNEQEGQKIDCGAINNPNPKLNATRYVVFYEVSEADVEAGTPIYFGITYIPDPDRQGGSLGSNVNIANPQIICLGETQEEADYKAEVAAIIVQQGPLRDRLEWAREDVKKTAADDFPWGQAALQEAIDTYQPVYDESLTIIDADGNVLNEDFIREKLAEKAADESAQLYSAYLLTAVQAMNSARNTFSRTNNPIPTTRTAIQNAQDVLDDPLYASGDKATFEAAIAAAQATLDGILANTNDDTRDADVETLTEARATLSEATDVFKASISIQPIIDIDFSGSFEENSDGYSVIKGTAGEMVFTGTVNADTNNDSDIAYKLGYGEEYTDVLRVGSGEATVTLPEPDVTDEEIVRFYFDMWVGNLSGKSMIVELRNANNERVAGFKLNRYDGVVAYNDFNNDANEGLNLLSYVSGAGSSSVNDAAICTDANKSSFDLQVNYKDGTVKGAVINGTNGTCTGTALPINAELTDNKVTTFVLSSDYASFSARLSWFDNLKVYKYAAGETGTPDAIKGDVNGDGTVDVADISSIISVMAGTAQYAAADVNGDGTVDVADISTVISIMAAQ